MVQAGAYGNQGYGQEVSYHHNAAYSYSVPPYGQPSATVYQNPYVTAQSTASGVMATDGTAMPNHFVSSTVPGYTVPAHYGGYVAPYGPSGGASASAAGNQG
jgi:hypothetical protein